MRDPETKKQFSVSFVPSSWFVIQIPGQPPEYLKVNFLLFFLWQHDLIIDLIIINWIKTFLYGKNFR